MRSDMLIRLVSCTIAMNFDLEAFSDRVRVRHVLKALLVCFLLPMLAFAQQAPLPPARPLPQNTGEAGLKQTLLRLRTTARLMHTDAHPDDEDGGMLVLESRGKGIDTLLLTLNRGEGGQNKIGSNLFDVLGIVRTLELLAADRYYGVQQRFTRVADFGFTKTASETFEKWQGHDPALRDIVRVIRTFRPDVIVSRFRGDDRDGHGQHQASGILTREAFRAAADPNRFPEQIKEGLAPWQAKKLYIDNVRPPMSTEAPAAEEYTLALDTGAVDPALGMSYVQFAMQGLKHQLSQGAGSWNVRPGPHISYYKLVDSVLPPLPPGAHENSFFDGIDTSITGIASRLGDEAHKVPLLREELERIQKDVEQASTAANPADAAVPLLEGFHSTAGLLMRVSSADYYGLSPAALAELEAVLFTKLDQFRQAANLALGITMEATVDAPPTVREGFMAVRGESFPLTVVLQKPAGAKISSVQLDVPHGWRAQRISPLAGKSGKIEARFRVTVAPDAPYTRPCVHRKSELQAIYDVENDACAVLPLPPPVVHAVATYAWQGRTGTIEAPVEVRFVEGQNIVSRRPLAVGPKFSVAVAPVNQVVQIGNTQPFGVVVSARTNMQSPTTGAVSVEAPANWQLTNGNVNFRFPAPGQERSVDARVQPATLTAERTYQLRASLSHDRAQYSEGYTLVTRPDIGSALYYQPADERISAVNVNVPGELKVGYIMGAGDEIPAVLRQLGMDVSLITDKELATGALSKYGTIVLGIRAYDTREDVRSNDSRLLDYVKNGGTLLVQYNADVQAFNSGKFTPYPAKLSRDRVTVEEAPVDILAPDSPVFRWPNKIDSHDFDGWVQERGLYFMSEWDSRFQPLLSSHDPGESAMKGGLLQATYGKGTYIYTGYAFFRQLPFGVPGAIRLFVNLVSAGHEKQ